MSARIGYHSAAERNKRPILDALTPWLAGARTLLELGAGDATHARYARRRLPRLSWQTSEAPAHYRRLVAALAGDNAGLPAPIALDVRSRWPERRFDAVYAANVAHIMDWGAVAALFAGAATHLTAAGVLCLYGPFFERGAAAGCGNIAFDEALRARDPAMGLRQVEALDALAAGHRLERVARLPMPADNRLLIWRAAAPV